MRDKTQVRLGNIIGIKVQMNGIELELVLKTAFKQCRRKNCRLEKENNELAAKTQEYKLLIKQIL